MSHHDELLRKREAREQGLDPYAPELAVEPNEDVLERIREDAGSVAAAHSDYQGAIMEERRLAGEIFERAVTYLRPALDAIVGKIETCATKAASARPGGGLSIQQTSSTHHAKRGVLIVDRFNVVHGERDVSGTYGGLGLYLLEDGTPALGRRSGYWSRRPGEVSLLELAMSEVDADEVLRHFRIDAILAGMATALDSQASLADQASVVHRRTQRLAGALIAVKDFLDQE